MGIVGYLRGFLLTGSFACIAMLGLGLYKDTDGNASSESALTLEEPERIFADIVSGQTYDVYVRVLNDSGTPRRVIGVEYSCGAALLQLKERRIIDVAPHASALVPCTLVVHRTGPFDTSVMLYLDDCGFRELPLTLKGSAAMPRPKSI
jgi:hypothetical protein